MMVHTLTTRYLQDTIQGAFAGALCSISSLYMLISNVIVMKGRVVAEAYIVNVIPAALVLDGREGRDANDPGCNGTEVLCPSVSSFALCSREL